MGVVRGFLVKKIIFFLDVCLSFGHVKPVVVVTRPVLADPSLSPPPTTMHTVGTLSLVESFIESEVPHLRLFLMLSMMPLKRWVATENVLTANEVWSKYFM